MNKKEIKKQLEFKKDLKVKDIESEFKNTPHIDEVINYLKINKDVDEKVIFISLLVDCHILNESNFESLLNKINIDFNLTREEEKLAKMIYEIEINNKDLVFKDFFIF